MIFAVADPDLHALYVALTALIVVIANRLQTRSIREETVAKMDSVYQILNGEGIMGQLKAIREWQKQHGEKDDRMFAALADKIEPKTEKK